MSNIIEEIKLYVKHGKFPIVQDKNKDYGIVTIVNDRIYGICSNWEQKREDLIIDYERIYFPNETIISEEWKIVGQYDIPTIPFEVGQKVKVREDLGELTMILYEEKKSMIGKIHEIQNTKKENGNYIYLLDGYTFHHDWLLPVLEEECACKKLTPFGHITVDSDGCCIKCGTKISIKTKRTVDDVLAGLSDEDKEIIMEKLK